MASLSGGVPYSIASLPKPFDASHGRIQAAPVYTVRWPRRRKRHEVVVGVDGETISILNIQTQNTVSAYAIPPHSYLTCPPRSVYCRRTKSARAQRYTFVVLKDSHSSLKQRLICFSEDVEKLKTLNDDARPTKKDIPLRAKEVVAVEILQHDSVTDGEGFAGILIIYEDGSMDCVSGNMEKMAWQHESTHLLEIQFATVFDGETGRRGILADREDVLALLGMDSTKDTASRIPQLLCVCARNEEAIGLKVYRIRVPSFDEVQSQKPGLQLVMEYTLPSTGLKVTTETQCDLNASSGKLYRLDNGRLTIFDLSNTTPRILTHLGNQKSLISTFTRLSSTLVVAIIGGRAVMYETRYGSVQDSVALSEVSQSNRKRKHSNDPSRSLEFKAVCGFGELSLVIGLAGNEIVAVQLADGDKPNKRAKTQMPLLANVVSKGIAAETLKLAYDDETSANFKAWKQELDATVKKSNTDSFEKLAAQVLRLKRQPYMTAVNDTETSPDEYTELTAQSFDIQSVDRRRALYLLSKCFAFRSEGHLSKGTRLTATAKSAAVYKWLALTGFLAPVYLIQARLSQSNMDGAEATVVPGDVMKAIGQFDMNFELMYEMLALPVPWDVEEIVQALKLLAQSFDVNLGINELLMPEQSATLNDDEDVAMVNADGDIESAIELESRAAEHEVSRAQSTLSHGLEVRSAALRLTLARLHAFPATAVTHAMSTRMTHHEIIFFINLLRIELAEGGWTRRYTDSSSLDDPTSDPEHAALDRGTEIADSAAGERAIMAIADMLNCAVDAIGISGWLVGLSGDAPGTSEQINALRAEVSAALEGCYEAESLKTILDELERFRALASRAALKEAQSGSVEKASMPLGGRVEAPVVRGRESKSSLRKSNHMINRERALRVGKYSFDRIKV